MKVLFLDIDGVLNSETSRIAAHNKRAGDWGTHRAWIPEAVDRLKRIIGETGCKLVISSDWRLSRNIQALRDGFTALGLPDWVGITPFGGQSDEINCIRGREIRAWLEEASERGEKIESFVILDDNNWMLPNQQTNFVHTNEHVGLTETDTDLAIRILGKLGV